MTWLFFGITPSFLEGAYQRILMFQNFFERALVPYTRGSWLLPEGEDDLSWIDV
jgi:hypothetical protein